MNKRVRALWAGAAMAAAFTLAACSGGTPAPTEPAEPTTPGESNEYAQAAQAVVDAAMAPIDEFVAPGPAIDTSSVPSGEVWYIAAAWQIPLFQVVKAGLDEAFAPFDITVQECDGKFTDPAAVSSCLDQAVAAKPLAIIGGSVPYEVAVTGWDNAIAAGIPVVFTQTVPAGDGDPTKVAYITPDQVEMQTWLTNWVIADSEATANTLVVSQTDHDGLIHWNQAGVLDVYPVACPMCTFTNIQTNTGQLDKLVTDVSAKLVADPTIGYVQAETDILLQSTIQGVQGGQRQSGDIFVTTMDGGLETVQLLESGQWIGATAGQNTNALAWYEADQALRLITGNSANIMVDFPFQRLFTAGNVGELDVTVEGFQSGAWFGKADYKAGFLELWGK